MRLALRPIALVCALLMVSFAMGPSRIQVVETEVESHPTKLVVESEHPRALHIPQTPTIDLAWPSPRRLLPQYSPQKEPRPPRRA